MSVQTLDGVTFDAIVFGELEPGCWMAGSNGFVRHKSFAAPKETVFNSAGGNNDVLQMAIVFGADRTITSYRNGQPYGSRYTADNLATFEAGNAQIVFGMRHSPAGSNKMLAGSLLRAQLYDRALTAEEAAASAGAAPPVSLENVLAAMSPAEFRERQRLVAQLSWIHLQQELLAGGPTYAVRPTAPEPTHVLARGNPAQRGEIVAPGGIAAAAPSGGDLGLSADAPEAERRIKLANWITGPAAPLAARVIANRLWHYHFGVGIVDTPNDFGFNGGRPSHPELLDRLARQLIDDGWSIKRLHRQIVLSATYRQSDRLLAEAQKSTSTIASCGARRARRLEARSDSRRDARGRRANELDDGRPGLS